MAYVTNNLDEELNQQKAGGGILAGSGGAANQGAQPSGSGFTNLQTYLSANKNQGAGLANQITAEGQKGVDAARTAADTSANQWADGVTEKALSGPSAVSSVYGGPIDATKGEGYNQMDQNYQNVRDQATKFAGDYDTQKASLMKANSYGTGFGALDTFLGRQDGKDKIQDWQKNVNTGSMVGAVQKANTAIKAGQDARFQEAMATSNPTLPGGAPDYGSGQMMPAQIIPQATPAPIAATGASSPWDGLKELLSEINGTPTPAPAMAPMVQASGGSNGGGYNTRQRRR
jgi:hypothetical protein